MTDANTPSGKYYDILSPYYEPATAAPGVWTPPQVLGSRLLDLSTPNSAILSIGIGTGQELSEVVAAGKYQSITGIDPSAEMLKICAKKFPQATLVHGDVLTVRLPGLQQFDVIESSGAFEFVADFERLIAWCRAKLKHSGTLLFTYEPVIPGHPIQQEAKSLVVSDPNSKLFVPEFYTYRRDPQVVAETLVSNGFKIASEKKFVAYHKGGSEILYCLVEAQG